MRLDVALAFEGLALLYLVIARWPSQTETRLVWAGLLCSRCPLPPSAPAVADIVDIGRGVSSTARNRNRLPVDRVAWVPTRLDKGSSRSAPQADRKRRCRGSLGRRWESWRSRGGCPITRPVAPGTPEHVAIRSPFQVAITCTEKIGHRGIVMPYRRALVQGGWRRRAAWLA